jgi:hypothetical protein
MFPIGSAPNLYHSTDRVELVSGAEWSRIELRVRQLEAGSVCNEIGEASEDVKP